MGALYIFSIQVFYQICSLKIFSPICNLSFHSLNNVSCRAEFKTMAKSNLSIFFFFYSLCFLCPKKSLPKPKSQTRCFFSRSFIVFSFGHVGLWTISSDFFFFFGICCEIGVEVHCFVCPIVPISFIEKAIHSPVNYLCIFVENKLAVYLWIYFC